jgi:hypothetical protein
MRHCPQCGTPHPEAAQRCPTCGLNVAFVRHASAAGAPSRTIVGGMTRDSDESGEVPDLTDTVKMSPSELPEALNVTRLQGPRGKGGGDVAPLSGAAPTSRTMLGIAPPVSRPGGDAPRIAEALEAGSPMSKPQGTLLGVARPGIAPLRPGVAKTPIDDEDASYNHTPPGYTPAVELGATYYKKGDAPPVPQMPPGAQPAQGRRFDKKMRLDKPVLVHPQEKRAQREAFEKKRRAESSRRGLYIIVAALGLAACAVLFAFLWPSAAPLTVQVRAGEGGAEVLDVKCPSCPDGTVLSLEGKKATVQGHHAVLDLPTRLAIGDTGLHIAIDRPGNGRDETVRVTARVAYRVRPDLKPLEGDHPAIQIVVEAMPGSKVTLDGEEVPLRDGTAVRTIDVAKELAGTSASSTSLDRKVAFTVTPPDGAEEKGVVAVSATILPLVIDAPGPAIVTDQSTFVLAGKTLPGAEIAAAGRALDVAADGTFARTMNVSSVGATQIEVRAKMEGKAPRYTKISVERVASLDTAEAEFNAKKPLGYTDLVKDVDGAKGKPVVLEGEVADVRPQAYSTLVVLNVKSGCESGKVCSVRLEVGSLLQAKRDQHLRVFGTGAGSFSDPGAGSGAVPVVDVAFARGDAVKP